MARSVFVAPNTLGLRIGSWLIAEVETAAREAAMTTLAVQSSVTAEQFYATLGFRRCVTAITAERNTYQKPTDSALGAQGRG
jgi:N-acetylglutamate synthase-like GNAT family acetyltransferase